MSAGIVGDIMPGSFCRPAIKNDSGGLWRVEKSLEAFALKVASQWQIRKGELASHLAIVALNKDTQKPRPNGVRDLFIHRDLMGNHYTGWKFLHTPSL